MENNRPDFLKNRPVAAPMNQVKDVYGSQKKSTRITLTVLLAAVDLVILVISLITGNYMVTLIFAPLLPLLVIAVIIGRRADRQNTPPQPSQHPDALFREHDE